MIDLRSDTATLPSPAMRKAMYEAELGDDVLGEDPTVNRLEEMAAERLGKEAAVFVATGTMANLVCCLSHCQRGDELILGDKSHIHVNEAGGVSSLGSIHAHTVPNLPDGSIRVEDVLASVRSPENQHHPRSRLLCLENTHNICDGAAVPLATVNALADAAHANGMKVHMDGARIFNAQVALGVPAAQLVERCDSVGFCLSKGLAAPVGSLVCGGRDFIGEARRWRKALGGGMRQAGVIAAAGIVALDEMVDRMAEDHENAVRLVQGIAPSPHLDTNPSLYKTNIIYFTLNGTSPHSTPIFLGRLLERGARVSVSNARTRRFRAVTHYGITARDIDAAIAAITAAAAP